MKLLDINELEKQKKELAKLIEKQKSLLFTKEKALRLLERHSFLKGIEKEIGDNKGFYKNYHVKILDEFYELYNDNGESGPEMYGDQISLRRHLHWFVPRNGKSKDNLEIWHRYEPYFGDCHTYHWPDSDGQINNWKD